MTNITVLVGSTRDSRQGINVAKWVASVLESRGHDVHLIDPLEHKELQMLSKMYKSTENPSSEFTKLKDTIESADGHIVVTPEYNHSYSGAIKNLIDVFLEEWSFKPFGIVTYSAGNFGGIRAAEALRPVLSEIGGVSTPISLAVSTVQDAVTEEGLQDDAYERRISRMLDEFEWYVTALKNQRESGTPY